MPSNAAEYVRAVTVALRRVVVCTICYLTLLNKVDIYACNLDTSVTDHLSSNMCKEAASRLAYEKHLLEQVSSNGWDEGFEPTFGGPTTS